MSDKRDEVYAWSYGLGDEREDSDNEQVQESHLYPDPTAWGHPITEERQIELDGLAKLQREWVDQPERTRGTSPLRGTHLTGADVFWLAKRAIASFFEGDMDAADAHLQSMRPIDRAYSSMSTLRLEGAVLFDAHLEGARLSEAHFEGADLRGARLEGTELGGAHLEGVVCVIAHLESAKCGAAHCEGANLSGAYLAGASLQRAHLEGADLSEAHLGGAAYRMDDGHWLALRQVNPSFPLTLLPVDLREAFLDRSTRLGDSGTRLGHASLGAESLGRKGARIGAYIADVHWGDANLAVLDWTPYTEGRAVLGDEEEARHWKMPHFTRPIIFARNEKEAAREARKHAKFDRRVERRMRPGEWANAARANRQLAAELRRQGLSDEADYFAYRALVLQRTVLRQRGKWGRWLFSGFLDLLAGYGYKPQRSLRAYLLTLALFAGLYLLASYGWLSLGLPHTQVHALQWYEALVLSVSSFHGRGFFQPLQNPGDPVAILAALEAVCGLIIEISFIATFTQRFFGK